METNFSSVVAVTKMMRFKPMEIKLAPVLSSRVRLP